MKSKGIYSRIALMITITMFSFSIFADNTDTSTAPTSTTTTTTTTTTNNASASNNSTNNNSTNNNQSSSDNSNTQTPVVVKYVQSYGYPAYVPYMYPVGPYSYGSSNYYYNPYVVYPALLTGLVLFGGWYNNWWWHGGGYNYNQYNNYNNYNHNNNNYNHNQNNQNKHNQNSQQHQNAQQHKNPSQHQNSSQHHQNVEHQNGGVVSAQRGEQRKAHVGFYLVDKGLPELRRLIGYRAPFFYAPARCDYRPPKRVLSGWRGTDHVRHRSRIVERARRYLACGRRFSALNSSLTQAAVELMNHLTTSLLRPRALPKLDFSKGIPDDCVTLVAVPRCCCRSPGRKPGARFGNPLPGQPRSAPLFRAADRSARFRPARRQSRPPIDLRFTSLRTLNRRYRQDGRPLSLLHRDRTLIPRRPLDGMGAQARQATRPESTCARRLDSFPVKVGDLDAFGELALRDHARFRHAASTRFGRQAGWRDGASAEPGRGGSGLEDGRRGVRNIQPRIGISIESASRSRLAAIYSGTDGFRYLYAGNFRCLSGSLRRSDLHGKRDLRNRPVSRDSAAAGFPKTRYSATI